MAQPNPLATPMAWDLLAPAYEADVLPTFQHFVEEALRLAAPPARALVADVACGPGTLALVAASRGHSVDALDFSPEMIALLERSARARGLGNIRARVGDGQALPYPDGRHDAAFSLFGLMFFRDRARGFAELRRILRPGARAVVSSWQPLDRSPTLVTVLGALEQALPDAPSPPARPPPLVTPEACRAEMERVFRAVEVRPASSQLVFPSPASLWASLERSMPPVALTRHRLGEQAWGPISGRVQDAVTERLGAGTVRVDLHAWLSVGTA